MKKILILVAMVILMTGCESKEEKELKAEQKKLFGTWETTYELKGFGEITESYVFKEKGECIRTLKTDTEIVKNCTYEINSTKDGIRILWDDKLNKERYSKYVYIDNNSIMIDENKYTKK